MHPLPMAASPVLQMAGKRSFEMKNLILDIVLAKMPEGDTPLLNE